MSAKIIEELRKVFDDSTVATIIETLGAGRTMRFPQFGIYAGRKGWNQDKRQALIKETVDASVRKDQKARSRNRRKRDDDDGLALFR